MQFSCESCKTQLQIADEKVRGKRLIVRCKRCGAKISISDPALGAARPRLVEAPPGSVPPPADSAPPSAGLPRSPAARSAAPPRRDSDTDSTRAMDSDLLEQALQASKVEEPTLNAAPPSAGRKPASTGKPAPLPAEPVWFAMLHGKQAGPFTRAELAARTDEGAIGPRTYLWKDGMSAWQRATDLPELEGLFPQLPVAPPLPPPVAPPAVAALREFSSPDLAGKPQPLEPAKPLKPAAQPVKPAAARAQAAGKPSNVGPLPFGDLVDQEESAGELFTPKKSSTQKPADLATWAAGELEKKPPLPRPATTPAPRMFEGNVPQHGRGPFVLVVLLVVAVAAVVLWLFLQSGARASQPSQTEGDAGASPSLATPADAVPSRDEKTAAKPAPKPEPPALTGLTADQVRRKLDENKAALQGCIDEALRRDPRLRVGKIHIATTIAPTGAVTQAKIDKNTVDQSPLGACLRRATKKISFPAFSGEAFDVDIPIVVTAGE